MKPFEDIGVTLLGPLAEIKKIKPYVPAKFGKDVGIVVINDKMTFDDVRVLLDESHEECRKTIVVEGPPMGHSTRYYGDKSTYGNKVMFSNAFDEIDGLRLQAFIEFLVKEEESRLWVNNTQSS